VASWLVRLCMIMFVVEQQASKQDLETASYGVVEGHWPHG